MNKISIVVPVYNAEKTLARTLDSLLEQTYKNIEIVCVDDGSKDNSFGVLTRYESDNSSLKVIHQENQGVSMARNTGIKHATGDIVMFVDADDSLVPNACSKVVEVFNERKAEVFTFGFKCEPAAAIPLGMNKELKPPSRYYPSFKPSLLFSDKARPYTCRTAISKALLDREHIGFEPTITLGEDQVIYFLLYPLANGVVLSPEQLYVYNMNNESATHSNATDTKGAIKKIEQHIRVVETILREWKTRRMECMCQEELLEWILDFVIFDINNLTAELRYSFFKRLLEQLNVYYETNLESITSSIPTKKCLKSIISNLAQSQNHACKKINFVFLSLFYVKRYGFIRCVQQVLIELGLLNKWKSESK